MVEQAPTHIGHVKHVLGSTVTVELNVQLAGVVPIYKGEIYRVGQIGSLVRVPQGLVDLVGTVSLLGVSEISGSQVPFESVQIGERWLQIQLIGEIDRSTGLFQRGVGSYPGLDDPVHFATAEDLSAVFPEPDEQHIRLGRLATAQSIPVSLNLDALALRHSAVVGATGAGKTSAVAKLLQELVAGGWDAANVVVIDLHGEYAKAMESYASVRGVLESGERGIDVPYWALPAKDILRAFVGSTGGNAEARFAEIVMEKRRCFTEDCEWLDLVPETITADTPVPFDLKQVWYQLQFENSATYDGLNGEGEVRIIHAGDVATLDPPRFEPYGPASTPPNRGPYFGHYGNTPNQLRLGLLDPKLDFLHRIPASHQGPDPLKEAAQGWLGRELPISVLDFSGVPTRATDIAIGAITSLLFELALRSASDELGIGRQHPLLIVLEEAHRFLNEQATFGTREVANRIAREGRKYGVGLMLVSQRPSELPDTALAQCGTLISLRLSNSQDQGTIRAALPDAIEGLADALSSLRTGEAIVSGEAVVVPARVIVDKPNPVPQSEDPSTFVWRRERDLPDLTKALLEWRGIYQNDHGE